MADTHFCQSCSMPIDDPELQGTERDGTKSSDYCKYCYQDGRFTHPDMTLHEMQQRMIHRMEKDKLPEEIIERALNRLPCLKRWSAKASLL